MNRRGLLIGALGTGGGLVMAAPAFTRPVPFLQLRNMSALSIDGVLPADHWAWREHARSPAVRLTFPDGYVTGWYRYDTRCYSGGLKNHGPAEAIEISIWAPNGMRAVSRIPVQF